MDREKSSSIKSKMPKEPSFVEQVGELRTRLLLEGNPVGKELDEILKRADNRLRKLPESKINAFMNFLVAECDLQDRARKMDNRELVWRFYQTDIAGQIAITGPASAIFEEIIRRLYPEWDGDSVTSTATGWATPEGEINYGEGD